MFNNEKYYLTKLYYMNDLENLINNVKTLIETKRKFYKVKHYIKLSWNLKKQLEFIERICLKNLLLKKSIH